MQALTSCRSMKSVVLLTVIVLLGFISSTVSGNTTSSLPGNCTAEEYQGIGYCVSAGSGFTFDQKKAERCPQRDGVDPLEWSDEDWQCHIYCSNPKRASDRKACTNCDEIAVSTDCFEAQTLVCEEFKLAADGATVDCDAANVPSGFFGGLLVFASIYLLF